METNIRKALKTSYSLSSDAYINLLNSSNLCDTSSEKLLKIVLAKYVKKLHRNLISEDNVISYTKHGSSGFKRIYIRWNAKEYCILLQLKFNTRFSTSYLMNKAIKECLDKIVMAIIRKKNKSHNFSKKFYKNLILKLDRFFVFWPNIEINPKVLPFFEMHIDNIFY